jgi:subtilisin family serine protease
VKTYGIKNYINELKGKKKIKVAVIDTGIDPNHEDLRGNIGKGYDFINYDSIPEDEQ